jgi:thiol-disulfide isomerase/thioredoxin
VRVRRTAVTGVTPRPLLQLARSDLDNIKKNGSDKPTLVLISKSWCGACKNLKQAFNSASGETREVEDLAKKFNMVSPH